MSKYFAGIGSRNTPSPILELMARITEELCAQGYILRSGGAKGADTAFQNGAPEDQMEIYLDEMHPKKQCTDGWYNVRYLDNLDDAIDLAEDHHPAWNRLGKKAKALITRNTYQVLGMDLNTPSEFVICWTPDGSEGTTTRETGGTGQAIRIAKKRGIKVLNLANQSTLDYVKVWLGL
ncbi:MAG: hypothetical protein JXR12_01090 [Neptunomonas phycophila]|uniref:hypothetical protein n=1 Tax=Neptunomonas phycophila TaxID=1572645 RepID=UPI003B8AB08C